MKGCFYSDIATGKKDDEKRFHLRWLDPTGKKHRKDFSSYSEARAYEDQLRQAAIAVIAEEKRKMKAGQLVKDAAEYRRNNAAEYGSPLVFCLNRGSLKWCCRYKNPLNGKDFAPCFATKKEALEFKRDLQDHADDPGFFAALARTSDNENQKKTTRKNRRKVHRCHDCGKVCIDYRCPSCWQKLRKQAEQEDFTGYNGGGCMADVQNGDLGDLADFVA